ncbi:Bin3 family protein [Schizosaccharomyces japonicus yFS275]|uniref:RNA methyltransferase n=1 Tax=Schizosaccharomyces japonicus (strain yFS275 / FY16936) TaxID=402676 RepID=B6JVZ4_SCHJY|nr:Bin3 family protein [Schizosaccharomyces japonicus yFS275]EEB05545.2 Bin3 family protein [Schizosaccharomyces japonicus yFS275]
MVEKFRYGNYHSYYTIRGDGSLMDPRLQRLPKRIFEGATVLDVGCNNATVTTQVAAFFDAKRVVGVDIDPVLIQKAHKHLEFYASRIGPRTDQCETMLERANFYPISAVKKFSRRPLAFIAENKDEFPLNVEFFHGNILQWTPPSRCRRFDTILAFSVVKWIHLNFGDNGLLDFFEQVSQLLRPEGTFVLELQEWKSYEKAAKKNPV